MDTAIMYHGDREEKFVNFIVSLVKMSCLPDKYVSMIVNKETIPYFHQCFTHSTVDSKNNYEYFEILGDGSINKAVVWYLSHRYPELRCPEGVKFLARLKNKLVSKDNLSAYSEQLGFFEFISSCEIIRKNRRAEILEDTFEAFMGCLEYLVDDKIKRHAGYSIVYDFISKLLDKTEIPSFDYETLWDSKSRLKELFDHISNNSLRYTFKRSKVDDKNYFETKITAIFENEDEKLTIVLGNGTGNTKIKSEQNAAEEALKYLKSKGIHKEIISPLKNP